MLVAVDLAAVAGLTALIGDSLDPGQVVLVVLLLTVLLYGPLRQWLGSWVRRLVLGDRDDPYDVVAGLATTLESADDGGEPSWPPSPGRSRRRSASPSSASTSTAAGASGSWRRTASGRPRPAPCRSPTAARRSAASSCRAAACAAG